MHMFTSLVMKTEEVKCFDHTWRLIVFCKKLILTHRPLDLNLYAITETDLIDQFQVGLIAQSIEQSISVADVVGLNPIQARISFCLNLQLLKLHS